MSELLNVFEFTATQAKALASEQSVADAPIVIGDVTVIPVSRLSCGFSCGGSDLAAKKKADGLMAGAGAKVSKTPLSFLAVCGKEIQFLHVPAEERSKKGLLEAIMPLAEQFREKVMKKKQDGESPAP